MGTNFYLSGRGDRDRTCDLMVPNHARYQLRYASINLGYLYTITYFFLFCKIFLHFLLNIFNFLAIIYMLCKMLKQNNKLQTYIFILIKVAAVA